MDAATVLAATAAERRSLAHTLDSLRPEQWAVPSLCLGWDVRTVAGHLVSAMDPTLLPFLAAVVRARGDLDRVNDVASRREARRPAAELVAALRDGADTPTSPPVTGPRAPLTDVLVHAGDIRLPLGLAHDPAGDHVRWALDFVATGRPWGFLPRRRLVGLRLVAEDLDVTWGSGDAVAGRGIDLLMAACGRTAVLGSLRGAGAVVLGERLGRSV